MLCQVALYLKLTLSAVVLLDKLKPLSTVWGLIDLLKNKCFIECD